METNRNPVGLIIGAIICIVVGISSIQIAYDTYEEIKSVTISIDDTPSYFTFSDRLYDRRFADAYKSDWWRDSWHKVRIRQQSNRSTILYASSFIFSMSLCCFTYICVKSYS